jgi:hypothetical protein
VTCAAANSNQIDTADRGAMSATGAVGKGSENTQGALIDGDPFVTKIDVKGTYRSDYKKDFLEKYSPHSFQILSQTPGLLGKKLKFRP